MRLKVSGTKDQPHRLSCVLTSSSGVQSLFPNWSSAMPMRGSKGKRPSSIFPFFTNALTSCQSTSRGVQSCARLLVQRSATCNVEDASGVPSSRMLQPSGNELDVDTIAAQPSVPCPAPLPPSAPGSPPPAQLHR